MKHCISLPILSMSLKLFSCRWGKFEMYYQSLKYPTIIVVTYEIRVFFEGAKKEVFSNILKYAEQAELKLCPNL
jgi:hypothetical protein